MVHGGGPQISAMLDRLGIVSEFKGGLRVTTPEAMDVVRMVLVGQVGRELVGLINEHGPYAVGLSGEDARLFTAVRRTGLRRRRGRSTSARSATSTRSTPRRVDRPHRRRPDPGHLHRRAGRRRACCTTSTPTPPPPRWPSRSGARKLVVLTDVPGLYADWPDTSSLISEITADELAKLLPSLESGMVPKMEACLRAVRGGVPAAHVVDGRVAHSTLLEVFTSEGFGTMVVLVMTSLVDRWSAVHDGQLRHPAAGAGPRRRRGAWSTRPAGSTSTCSAASRSTRSATPTRPWSPRSSKQIATLGHVSNLFVAEPPVALAELLLALAGRPGRVFFGNSGAEANEAAFKLSRLTGRTHVVATDGGFHGRTMGALALTGQPAKADPFRPLPGDVTHVPYGDVAALAAAVTDETAMVILEPIQGENGVVVPPPGYLAAARRDHRRRTARCWCSTRCRPAIGRTGHWFAHQADGVEPDVITLAKGLGGGLPIGACLAFGPAADLFAPGMHGTTFGGNPVSCAAALAVISHHRQRGPARPRQADRRADPARRRGARPPAGRRGPRRRPAARHRADARRPPRRSPACCATPASWSTRCSRT